jgi:hypothetical protein
MNLKNSNPAPLFPSPVLVALLCFLFVQHNRALPPYVPPPYALLAPVAASLPPVGPVPRSVPCHHRSSLPSTPPRPSSPMPSAPPPLMAHSTPASMCQPPPLAAHLASAPAGAAPGLHTHAPPAALADLRRPLLPANLTGRPHHRGGDFFKKITYSKFGCNLNRFD